MIVLDENIARNSVIDAISAWYPGAVRSIKDLRPFGVIADDRIPTLLRGLTSPVFVTTNTTDFWQSMPADPAYCALLFPLPNDRQQEIAPLLRALFKLPKFRTERSRMGKVVLVAKGDLRYYAHPSATIHYVSWG